jgi:hypothetical protein
MVADFMNQDVSDDLAQSVLVFGPIVENGPAVQPDHIGHQFRRRLRLKRQANTLKQPEQIKFALEPHRVDDLVVGEILDPDDQTFAQFAEVIGQAAIGLRRQSFNVSQRRRRGSSPIVEWGCHGNVVGELGAPTKRLTEPARMRNGWP